jgi:hypothetical protein
VRKDKQKAIELRQDRKSYNYISKKLGVPKSTLSSWFKEIDWSLQLREILKEESSFRVPERLKNVLKANQLRWQKLDKENEQKATEGYPQLKLSPLFNLGLSLYWSLGDQSLKNNIVSVSSNDPQILKVINSFLISFAKDQQEKISAKLIIYPDLNEGMQKNFWSLATGIPSPRFKKSTVIKTKSNKRSSYGICEIFVNSRALKLKILKWLELYKQDIGKLG